MGSYLCGLDIGGTFTDCVLIDEQGALTIAKAPSTPGNFAEGVIEAIERAAAKIGLGMSELLDSISVLAHGTTVGQLDATQQFYLQSRGIPAAEAKRMLSLGFVNELLMALPDESVAQWATPWLEEELTHTRPSAEDAA